MLIVNYEIIYTLNGDIVNQYQLTHNDLTHFIGFTNKNFATQFFTPIYRMYLTDRSSFIITESKHLQHLFKEHLTNMVKIKAYPVNALLTPETCIEFLLIETNQAK